MSGSLGEVTGQLVADEDETGAHQRRVGSDGAALEAAAQSPDVHGDEDQAQGHELPKFDADVEREEVRDHALGRERQILELGCKAEAMKQAEDEYRGTGIGRPAEHRAKAVEVVDCLVGDGQPDDGIDDVGIGANVEDRTDQQRRAVPDREQRDVSPDVLHPVEEKDDSGEEEQMVVTRDHVLRAEVHVRQDGDARTALDEGLVRFSHSVGLGRGGDRQRCQKRAGGCQRASGRGKAAGRCEGGRLHLRQSLKVAKVFVPLLFSTSETTTLDPA
ncbi:hypothetical protein PP1Y_Mpl3996 (plasmid) [Novosphingobium sp. PP1Y]|nr:hypothetical protein PP1Y_Mpl3996 [Novosphingobium sp. PP1Y]